MNISELKKRSSTIIFHIIFSLGLLILAHKIGLLLGHYIINLFDSSIPYREWARTCLAEYKPAELLGYIVPACCLFFYYFFAHLQANHYINVSKWLNFNPTENKKRFSLGLILLAGLLVFHTGIMFRGSAIPLISNDYMDIPEQTKINNVYVDNTNYINQHRLGGLLKYDPRLFQHQSKLVAGQDYIPLTAHSKLLAYALSKKNKYVYDSRYHGLFVNDLLSRTDIVDLYMISDNEQERKNISDFYKFNSGIATHPLAQNEGEFIKKNQYEMQAQAVAGHYFHHQYAFLGPMNEYLLGKPQTQTMFLYGWLNTVVIAKLASHGGSINFANYLKWTFVFYPLYFVLVALVAAIIFRNIWSVLFIVLLSLMSVFAIGFEGIHLAPGFNPIRHFFDIAVLLFWYGYLVANRKNTLFLGLATGCAVVAFLADKEFGLFILAAFYGAYIVRAFDSIKVKWVDHSILLLGFLGCAASFLLIKTGANPDVLYYLLGVSIPPTKSKVLWLGLFGLVMGYMYLLQHAWKDRGSKYLFLYLFIYIQAALLYYIWYAQVAHFYVFVPAMAFLLAIVYRELCNSFQEKIPQGALKITVFLLVIFAYVPLTMSYIHDQNNYFKIFKDHKTYYWDIPTAGFISTMNPQPFYNAIKLMTKYSNNNGIYIISKYDNSLPFFAKKYSLMPFLQLDLSIVTDKEIKMAVDTILQNKPKYLFVDSDIEHSRQGDIYRANDSIAKKSKLHFFSHGRALVLDNLSEIFRMVSASYVPLEDSGIITVYKRKDQASV